MSCENMLELMKKALLIPATEHYADDEIETHIASCRQLLVTTGVPREIAESDDHFLTESILAEFGGQEPIIGSLDGSAVNVTGADADQGYALLDSAGDLVAVSANGEFQHGALASGEYSVAIVGNGLAGESVPVMRKGFDIPLADGYTHYYGRGCYGFDGRSHNGI